VTEVIERHVEAQQVESFAQTAVRSFLRGCRRTACARGQMCVRLELEVLHQAGG
jgi:hypothetical protein